MCRARFQVTPGPIYLGYKTKQHRVTKTKCTQLRLQEHLWLGGVWVLVVKPCFRVLWKGSRQARGRHKPFPQKGFFLAFRNILAVPVLLPKRAFLTSQAPSSPARLGSPLRGSSCPPRPQIPAVAGDAPWHGVSEPRAAHPSAGIPALCRGWIELSMGLAGGRGQRLWETLPVSYCPCPTAWVTLPPPLQSPVATRVKKS